MQKNNILMLLVLYGKENKINNTIKIYIYLHQSAII